MYTVGCRSVYGDKWFDIGGMYRTIDGAKKGIEKAIEKGATFDYDEYVILKAEGDTGRMKRVFSYNRVSSLELAKHNENNLIWGRDSYGKDTAWIPRGVRK